MSWSLFKRNVLRKTNPNTNPSLTVPQVAKVWANEYDAAVKRGKDFINLESVRTGNKQIMESLFQVALLKGLATPPGQDFSLPNEFGNGVKAYWAGAQMNPFPIPLIPAPGTIQNIAVNSNIVSNIGVWPMYPPIKPARRQEIMVNMFVLAAIVHLFSIGGFIQTTSLYPSAPSPVPGPAIIGPARRMRQDHSMCCADQEALCQRPEPQQERQSRSFRLCGTSPLPMIHPMQQLARHVLP